MFFFTILQCNNITAKFSPELFLLYFLPIIFCFCFWPLQPIVHVTRESFQPEPTFHQHGWQEIKQTTTLESGKRHLPISLCLFTLRHKSCFLLNVSSEPVQLMLTFTTFLTAVSLYCPNHVLTQYSLFMYCQLLPVWMLS